ncbi:FAD-dependent monooxygenase [Nonomuraea sp. JJY05]|uniref:FAD-dependent monooxygenase n=1 Tax=Nonomuraea sp. JJY05 TaxID=3350255 RepID=UPI00373E30B3
MDDFMQAEAAGLLREGGRVTGVRFRGPDGDRQVRAHLTVAADGRHSAVRPAAGLRPREYGAPMDVLQFRISRRDSDPDEGYHLRMAGGRSVAVINRGTYRNIAYMIRKGGREELRRAGIQPLRDDIADLVGFLAAVRRRRWAPTVATQALQRTAQRFGIDRALRGQAGPDYRMIARLPFMRALTSRLLGVGVRPEHVRPATAAPQDRNR